VESFFESGSKNVLPFLSRFSRHLAAENGKIEMKSLKLPVLNKNGQGDFKSTKRSEFRQTANFILTVKKTQLLLSSKNSVKLF
jgi:hypothetical protein